MSAKSKRIAGYIRVSNKRDDMESPELQRGKITQWANQNGYRPSQIEWFEDLDYSGRRGSKSRPGLKAILSRLDDFDVVTVAWLSRQGRSVTDNQEVRDILKYHSVDFVAVDMQHVDAETPVGALTLRQMDSINEFHSDLIAEQWREWHGALAKRGGTNGGGATPYGYRFVSKLEALETKRPRGVHVDQKQAEVVRQIFDRYVSGESLHSITDWLNAAKIPTRSGGAWSRSVVAAMLENASYIGVRRHWHKKTQLVKDPDIGKLVQRKVRTGTYDEHEASWEPIIDRKTWEKAVALREATKEEARKKASPRQNAGSYLLSGLLTCGSCGTTMHHKGNSYICPEKNCPEGGVLEVRAEHMVLNAFLKFSNGQDIQKALRPPKPKKAKKPQGSDGQMKEIERQMERLVEMQVELDGPVALQTIKKKLDALEAKYAELKQRQSSDVVSEIRDESAVRHLQRFRTNVAQTVPELWEPDALGNVELVWVDEPVLEEHDGEQRVIQYRTLQPTGGLTNPDAARRLRDLLSLHSKDVTDQRELLGYVIDKVRTVPGSRPRDLRVEWKEWVDAEPMIVTAPIKRRWQKKPEEVAS